MIIGYRPGYRTSWQTGVGDLGTSTITDNTRKWKGDHIIDPTFVPGVLFSNTKLQDSATQLDIAPTILDAMGLKIPERMDGKSLLK